MIRRCTPVPLLLCLLVLAGCAGDPEKRSREHLEAGNRQFAQQAFQEAAIEYQNALKINPRLAAARLKLGETYLQLGVPQRALAEYSRAADLLPDDLEVQITLGRLLALHGRFEDARGRAELVLKRNPSHIDAQLLLGNSLAGLKDLDAAVAEIEAAIQLDPSEARSHANLGAVQMVKGNADAARAAFEKAVELDPRSSSAHLALAGFYWSVRDVAAAERHMKTVLELEPGHPVASRSLAALYIGTDRVAAAEPYLKQIAQQPGNVAGQMALADYYIMMRRHQDATAVLTGIEGGAGVKNIAEVKLALIAYADGRRTDAHQRLDRVLESRAADSTARLAKARFLLAEQNLDGALHHAKAAVAADPKAPAAHYLLGTVHAGRKEFVDAANAFSEVLKLNPRATPARLQLARLDLLRGNGGNAITLAREVVAADPRNVAARMVLIDALLQQRIADQAEQALTALAAEYPELAPLDVRFGRLAVLKKDLAGARQAFDRALAREPRSLDALTGLVAIDLTEGRATEASTRVDTYLKTNPRNPGLLTLAARAYVATGNFAKAEEALQQVITAEPANMSAYDMLGRVYLAQKKLDAARARFDEISRRDPNAVGADTLVAIILEAQNRTKEAQQRYERILDRNPGAAVAANNLAWLYAEGGGDLDRALRLAQSAQRAIPDDPRVTDTIGWIYYRKQLPLLAIPEFERSLQKDPRNAVIHYHLGLAYLATGDTVRGRRALQQALQLQPDFPEAGAARAALARVSG